MSEQSALFSKGSACYVTSGNRNSISRPGKTKDVTWLRCPTLNTRIIFGVPISELRETETEDRSLARWFPKSVKWAVRRVTALTAN